MAARGKQRWHKRQLPPLDKEICRSLLGTSYNVHAEIWNQIEPCRNEELKSAQPKHLFWALVMLKVYGTEFSLFVSLLIMDNANRKTSLFLLQ